MPSPSFCGVILAAGESTRMGSEKALLPWRGSTFLATAIRALDPFSDYVIVVAGANASRLEPVVDACGAFLVKNPRPQLGQFSSLRVGLREVLNRGRDAALVTLVDRPAANRETVNKIQRELCQASERGVWAVIPEHGGQHGHPIAVGTEMIFRLLNAPGTSNAREVLHQHQEKIEYLPVDDPLVVANINTPEQYAALTPERRRP